MDQSANNKQGSARAPKTAPAVRDGARMSLLDSLLLVARLEGKPSSQTALTAGLPLEEGELTPDLFIRAANRGGLAALLLKRALIEIPRDVLPAIILLKDGKSAVLTDIDPELGHGILSFGDNMQREQRALSQLEADYTGNVFYLRPMQEFDARTPKIHKDTGQHWFWGVLKASTSIYRDVLLASLFINLFVLAQPLFVMNVYDRVVPNNAVETLWALAIGVLIVYLFDLGLKILRSYMVELAAKRTDVILSSNLFERILSIKMRNRPVSVGALPAVCRNSTPSAILLLPQPCSPWWTCRF